jgi:hypothetical protein
VVSRSTFRRILLALDCFVIVVVPGAIVVARGWAAGAFVAACCLAFVIVRRWAIDPRRLERVWSFGAQQDADPKRLQAGVSVNAPAARVMAWLAGGLTILVAINVVVGMLVGGETIWIAAGCLAAVWFGVAATAISARLTRRDL